MAGIGNIFLGDDGFGVEVASRLAAQSLPARVRVLDIGIRARDLAYELIDGGYDTAILVDATMRGGTPGTVYLIEPEIARGAAAPPLTAGDGHSMEPAAMLAFIGSLTTISTQLLIVGCEPEAVDEHIGLSPVVEAAVDEAVTLVRQLVCA
ncbi:MAG TPA: hydrogenase maturation protease [Vicinamibacterales bacterium]|nr:hydrogenase maturation protease [Vicinamibacterales bacterium]